MGAKRIRVPRPASNGMKIILLKDVPGIGQRGAVKDISDGYALNFLIPKKLAEHATPKKVSEHEAWNRAVGEAREKQEEENASYIERLHGVHVTISTKANATGKLYKQVTPDMIAEHIQKQFGISLSPKNIELEGPVRTVGECVARIRFGTKHAKIAVHVEDEGLDKTRERL